MPSTVEALAVVLTAILPGGLCPDPTLPLWLWAVAGMYIALPIALGVVIGQGVLKSRKLALLLAGSNAAPTAWDFLFSPNPNGWIRCKLESGA